MTVSFTDHVAILVTADLIDLELWSSYAQRATLTYAIFFSAGTKICIISTSFTRCSCFYHLLLWTLLLNYIINCHHYLHTMNAITTIICHHYLHTYWQRYQTSDIARSRGWSPGTPCLPQLLGRNGPVISQFTAADHRSGPMDRRYGCCMVVVFELNELKDNGAAPDSGI